MKHVLVIMGSHPRTRGEFDWTRDDCDVLVFNEAMKQAWVQRADYVMQLHLPVIWRNPGNRNDANHYEWLKSGNTPIIWMQEEYEDVPRSKKYPLDEVIKLGGNYLTSSAAYAIAWGIYSGYERIEIYGVEMETNTEYQNQRPGIAYWVGFGRGAGVDIDFHGNLLTCPLYGYEGDIKLPYEYFDKRTAELMVTVEASRNEYNEARETSNRSIEEYVDTGKEPEIVIKLLQKQVQLGALFGMQDGARQEVARYKGKADVQVKATGNYLFSRQEYEFSASTFIKNRDVSINDAKRLAEECQKQFNVVRSTGNASKRKARIGNFMKFVALYVQESVKVGMYDGAAKENMLFMKRLDELVLMAGGVASAEVMTQEMAVPA